MINVNLALMHLGINPVSAMIAVQQVREYLEVDGREGVPCRATTMMHLVFGADTNEEDSKLLGELLNPPVGTAYDYALVFAQSTVEQAIKLGCQIEDTEVIFQQARERAHRFITNPDRQYYFAKADVAPSATVTQVAVATGIDVKVDVKADGKIKKGGKQVLAAELYKKHVLNGAPPLDNQGFIALLMKELGMSKAGATTYNYNCKKEFGGVIASRGNK